MAKQSKVVRDHEKRMAAAKRRRALKRVAASIGMSAREASPGKRSRRTVRAARRTIPSAIKAADKTARKNATAARRAEAAAKRAEAKATKAAARATKAADRAAGKGRGNLTKRVEELEEFKLNQQAFNVEISTDVIEAVKSIGRISKGFGVSGSRVPYPRTS